MLAVLCYRRTNPLKHTCIWTYIHRYRYVCIDTYTYISFHSTWNNNVVSVFPNWEHRTDYCSHWKHYTVQAVVLALRKMWQISSQNNSEDEAPVNVCAVVFELRRCSGTSLVIANVGLPRITENISYVSDGPKESFSCIPRWCLNVELKANWKCTLLNFQGLGVTLPAITTRTTISEFIFGCWGNIHFIWHGEIKTCLHRESKAVNERYALIHCRKICIFTIWTFLSSIVNLPAVFNGLLLTCVISWSK